MSRQSITLTRPNDDWLKSQVESEEYSSKSEIVNDLIRKERARQEERQDIIRAKLIEGEESGYSKMDQAQILAESKARYAK